MGNSAFFQDTGKKNKGGKRSKKAGDGTEEESTLLHKSIPMKSYAVFDFEIWFSCC